MAETKKSGIRLDTEAVELLDKLAPGYNKGRFVSQLIKDAAARQGGTPTPASQAADRAALRQELARLAGELARIGQVAVEMASVTQQLLALDGQEESTQ